MRYKVWCQVETIPDAPDVEPVNVTEDDEVFQCETLEEAEQYIESIKLLGGQY